ncbi:MAG: TetR/AcrR family transcriptional regulator [Sphaerochaetaceae bacterium]|nr:TetR/AcrR family transcriptional regulator [Sphaerochaetaceae bacterium]
MSSNAEYNDEKKEGLHESESEPKKLDFRVQRTYGFLTKALVDLLKKKDFSEITVNELCEKALIRRATFYKHFTDKLELFKFVVNRNFDFFGKSHNFKYDRENPGTFYPEIVNYILSFAEENKAVLQSIFSGSAAAQLTSIMLETTEHHICKHLKQDIENGAREIARPELLAAMMSGAIVYMANRWVKNNIDVSKEEILNLCKFITNRFYTTEKPAIK